MGPLREARPEEKAVNAGERRLAALALALIGDDSKLTLRERETIGPARPPARETVAEVKAMILAGDDVLGAQFCRLRGPAQRRARGATYTPRIIVDAMAAWTEAERAEPARIVDPGSGSGRFLVAAAKSFPKALLIGVDIDPLATLMLRANAAVCGFADRLATELIDYRQLALDPIAGKTLFIGNPPYVRHHDIDGRWKEWFALTAARYGFKASKLAGLHIHFFLKTRELAKPGDFGVFITAAEWLDVNYGSVLRHMLADGLGGTAVHIISPQAQPFEDAMSTGAITCFRVGNRPASFLVRSVSSLSELGPLDKGRAIDWDAVRRTARWSTLVHARKGKPAGVIELGEVFRVHRGQVTGNNAAWIENPAMGGLPARYLRPTVTRARELIAAGDVLRSTAELRRVLDIPADLSELSPTERKAVERFLKWAKAQGTHRGYIAAHRRAWWSVELRKPAPILCTYMARRAPTFVLNVAEARHLNIAHGLYPRATLTVTQLSDILAYLRQHTTTEGGRTYAGGLVKFEPRELERMHIPALERLHDRVAHSLDA